MTEERERADQDSPWKEILEAYFPQAMQFFFPQTAALINWDIPHEFLDKEFQQIARDAEQGRRYAVDTLRPKGAQILSSTSPLSLDPLRCLTQRWFSS
jgi:hypothetical protein